MSLLLGVDTGGTYTDAVILDEGEGSAERAIKATAKALTTKHDLSVGIGEAIDRVLTSAKVSPADISLVSISTTLATNALVEGQGERVGLVFIGFEEAELDRAGLSAALGDDPVVRLAGGHNAAGEEIKTLDVERLEAWLSTARDRVEAFAVASYFSVRNPSHELAASEIVRGVTGKPVTCSHELSAAIGGPKRALTGLLNARLIGLLHRLVGSAEALMADRGIEAPLMVVRGDGALVSAEFAKTRPIETILSGPAASLVGASYLVGSENALVSDIGGTTTDIAVIRDGKPKIDPRGASVGGWRTMVEAVAMSTHGLGGDSEVRLLPEGLEGKLLLGPKRVIPVSLFASQYPKLVQDALDRALSEAIVRDTDGRFAVLAREDQSTEGLKPLEVSMIEQLRAGPKSLNDLIRSRMAGSALSRLVSLGRVAISGFTPSDAAHVLGLHESWDSEAAMKAAKLFARQKTPNGLLLSEDSGALCQRVIDLLIRRSAELVLETAFEEDGLEGTGLSQSTLARAALDRRRGFAKLSLDLDVPLIGLGASAPTYYPQVTELLGAEAAVPAEAGVANAIGAVVGRVRIARKASITQPAKGIFRAHLSPEPQDYKDYETAFEALVSQLKEEIREASETAGAREVEVHVEEDKQAAEINGEEVFFEALITVSATGRPKIA